MKYFAPFRLILPILCTSVIPVAAQLISPGKTFNGPDRTITWRRWQQNAKDEFRFRTGDRYLGRAVWEHYLGFEQFRTSSKAIYARLCVAPGDDPRTQQTIASARAQILDAENTNWQESFRLIRRYTRIAYSHPVAPEIQWEHLAPTDAATANVVAAKPV